MVGTLVTGQTLAGIGVSVAIGVGTLLGEDLGHSVSLAGFTQTAWVIGAALFALPLARFAARRGRRPALATGYLIGATGAGLVALSAAVRSYPLLLVGCLLFGAGSAAGLQARYAAADLATDERRGRDLSAVVWAATIGALVAPVMLDPTGRLAGALGLPTLAGPFLATAVALAVSAVVVGAFLRPDPLILAGGTATTTDRPASMRSALAAARGSVGIAIALASMASAHVCMIAVMSFTPVQMRHHGAGLGAIGYVIGVHVVSMYALAPVFGRLADRLGRIPVVLCGHLIVALGSGVAAFATDHGPVPAATGLILLGLGWSTVIVAGSALLTESAAVADRPGVQGLSDFLISAVGAGGALVGGLVVAEFGFASLAFGSVALSALLAAATGAASGRARPEAAVAAPAGVDEASAIATPLSQAPTPPP
jgi:MFS family permease